MFTVRYTQCNTIVWKLQSDINSRIVEGWYIQCDIYSVMLTLKYFQQRLPCGAWRARCRRGDCRPGGDHPLSPGNRRAPGSPRTRCELQLTNIGLKVMPRERDCLQRMQSSREGSSTSPPGPRRRRGCRPAEQPRRLPVSRRCWGTGPPQPGSPSGGWVNTHLYRTAKQLWHIHLAFLIPQRHLF